MARRPRAEVAGGLYPVIARGNNRQVIFHSDEDHKKFLSLLGIQKQKLGFLSLWMRPLNRSNFHSFMPRLPE
jgi:hypothetical protein